MLGKEVSHYRIVERLGSGGMGVVYKAEDTRLHRFVALKFLAVGVGLASPQPGRPRGAPVPLDPVALERFKREAQTASALNHPNICTIYEIDEFQGQPFIAMELLEGQSLKERAAGRRVAPDELLEIARQVADGLSLAHSAGISHRDLKPANIFLIPRGATVQAKILDFGLAKLTREAPQPSEGAEARSESSKSTDDSLTGPGIGPGTVAYMPPERLRRQPVDTRGDIFSFGVLLYECLTGRLPFRGETPVDVQYAILHQHPSAPSSLAPGISRGWDELVGRCLRKIPEQRYASMAEVLEALGRIGRAAARLEKSVAVLYFENLTEAKSDEYFRDGMTEDIITELSKIRELSVVSRSSVLPYRDQRLTAAQAGQQLSVSYVLEGSLRRADDRLRITAQLVESSTARTVWAERFDRTLRDVFAIQDEIAQNVARALRVVLSEQENQAIRKVPTADVEAYDCYLRGRNFFHQFRRKGYEFARQMFARAIEIDPRYARAYAGIADCCSFLYMYWESSEENLQQADTASLRALEIDPDLAEAHASRGLVASLKKRHNEAEHEFEIAAGLNPRLFEAYYFRARNYFSQGKLEEATRWFEQASRAGPEDYQSPMLMGSALAGLDKKAEAAAAFHRGLLLARKHLELHPGDARALYFGANALCQLGDREQALHWAGQALEMEPGEPQVLYNVACVYALLGEPEKAIDCLEKSVTHARFQRDWMEHDPDLASLREHPRFKALLLLTQEKAAPNSSGESAA